MRLKVGELAKRTGLTVRALHHYDAIGLLRPSFRTVSGHRLYGDADVAKLQRIVSLRDLGFPLEEIAACLGKAAYSPRRLVRLHLERMRARIEAENRLCEKLEGIARKLDAKEKVSVDEFLDTIEEMTMFEKYYTKEQLATLKERGEKLGPEGMKKAQDDWKTLIAEVRAEMDRGTDPADARMKPLLARWNALIQAFTGGDPGIAKSLSNFYRGEKSAARQFEGAPDPDVMGFVAKASAAAADKKK